MNTVMRISLLGSRTENLIKCACRWGGLNEILLLIISVYLINIHHTAETSSPTWSYYHPFVCQSGRKIEIPAAEAIVLELLSWVTLAAGGSAPSPQPSSHIKEIKWTRLREVSQTFPLLSLGDLMMKTVVVSGKLEGPGPTLPNEMHFLD